MTSRPRRLAGIAVAALLALAPVACGSDDDSSEPTVTTQAGPTATTQPSTPDTGQGSGGSTDEFCTLFSNALGSPPETIEAQRDFLDSMSDAALPEMAEATTELSQIAQDSETLADYNENERTAELLTEITPAIQAACS